ncbi:UDP-N-acetylmuramoyl-L-alanine--D-glutamate ligase [Isoptericola sp. NEAU-Y5]|uniref:UDP-N-acetylmuramoylalanine--D-glutamate ligase n=1 Tax=Isoptericola luteus TaxID=2879484 RepID=A0ABS7ZDM9_9MICO|nr:UDP-N-acetylmuramoyl-L-alanine--D-glutamate ligase [Isoptericola sp. NEAU-Y5]MCA5893148.1 UDP-N-acetylmuramoyl-L-alanine--D-glutamate ligase [Isoptericola sp. NEAU-Y5]
MTPDLTVGLGEARVVVAGLGVTGRAVADALAGRVRSLVTVDTRAEGADVRDADDPRRAAEVVAAADLVVASPGWPPSSPLLAAAAESGVPVWSEVELAWRLRTDRGPADDGAARGPAPWLGVTGTNGKTTTVEMLASILGAAGLRTAAVGNVGAPLVAAALDPSYDVLAVELSSFQLHFTGTTSFEAAAVLNLAPDHLDWHGSFEAYARDKGRILDRVQVACVYNVADPATRELVEEADVVEGARAVGCTLGAPALGQVGVVEDVLVDRAFHAASGTREHRTHATELATLADLAHLAPPGAPPAPHVVADALAAAALARAHGVPAVAVRDGLRAFRPGAHRIALVRELGGVSYVDDSKATNAHAAAASLGACAAGTVVWVAGGLAKGASFDELVSGQADRLRAAVLIGADPAPLRDALARHAPQVPVVVVDPGDTGSVMRRAVAAAQGLAREGDTVLLAPAGASMDQFASYARRGEAFATAVQELTGTP